MSAIWPAFPHPGKDGVVQPGMSKREVYAALAMQSLIASAPELTMDEVAERAAGYGSALARRLDANEKPKKV